MIHSTNLENALGNSEGHLVDKESRDETDKVQDDGRGINPVPRVGKIIGPFHSTELSERRRNDRSSRMLCLSHLTQLFENQRPHEHMQNDLRDRQRQHFQRRLTLAFDPPWEIVHEKNVTEQGEKQDVEYLQMTPMQLRWNSMTSAYHSVVEAHNRCAVEVDEFVRPLDAILCCTSVGSLAREREDSGRRVRQCLT